MDNMEMNRFSQTALRKWARGKGRGSRDAPASKKSPKRIISEEHKKLAKGLDDLIQTLKSVGETVEVVRLVRKEKKEAFDEYYPPRSFLKADKEREDTLEKQEGEECSSEDVGKEG